MSNLIFYYESKTLKTLITESSPATASPILSIDNLQQFELGSIDLKSVWTLWRRSNLPNYLSIVYIAVKGPIQTANMF